MVVLKSKGYALKVINIEQGEGCLYVAEKDRRTFVGYSGSEVLGLVALWENLGDDWQSKSQSMPKIIPDIVVEEEDGE
jgi:hypothetical protein